VGSKACNVFRGIPKHTNTAKKKPKNFVLFIFINN
jgi:hypothetical protein